MIKIVAFFGKTEDGNILPAVCLQSCLPDKFLPGRKKVTDIAHKNGVVGEKGKSAEYFHIPRFYG